MHVWVQNTSCMLKEILIYMFYNFSNRRSTDSHDYEVSGIIAVNTATSDVDEVGLTLSVNMALER